MKHFLFALVLGTILLSCNRDHDNNEITVPETEKQVLVKKLSGEDDVYIRYKNGNEIQYLIAYERSQGISVSYEYDGFGKIIKENRFDHPFNNGKTNMTYQYDIQGRLTSSYAIYTTTNTGCTIERKHTYTYQGNKVTVKMELITNPCSSDPEERKEKTITLFVENGRVVKSLDENNQIIETIEYYNTKNALRNIKGFPALVLEFYLRKKIRYHLDYSDSIEEGEDIQFIDNVKSRDSHDEFYVEYKYEDSKGNAYDGDYPEKLESTRKSHYNPSYIGQGYSYHMYY